MREAGYQLERLQSGREPRDWKPMRSIGRFRYFSSVSYWSVRSWSEAMRITATA